MFASKDKTNATTVDVLPTSTSTDAPSSSAQDLCDKRVDLPVGATAAEEEEKEEEEKTKDNKSDNNISTDTASTDKGEKHGVVEHQTLENGEANAAVETGTSAAAPTEKGKLSADAVSEAKHESKTDGEEQDTDIGTCLKEKTNNVDLGEMNGTKNGETVGQKRPSPKKMTDAAASFEDEDMPTKKRKESSLEDGEGKAVPMEISA